MGLDRTQEFFAVVDTLSAHANKPGLPSQAFGVVAASISRDIHGTAQKLGELTRLVQRRSVFAEQSQQINRLVFDIKEDITGLKTRLDDAGAFAAQQKARSGGQPAQHSVTVVGQLQAELKGAADTFQSVLQQRTEKLKADQQRRGQYGQARLGPLGKPLIYTPTKPNPDDALPRPGATPPAASPLQLQQQQLLVVNNSHEYLEDRANAMGEIEKHISELGQLFGKLNVLIASHGDMIQRIDDDIEEAHTNVEGAREQLVRAWSNMQGNRKLVLKLFAVLIFFILLFVLVL